MSQLATCLRCSAPLTEGNAQAIDPSICITCLSQPVGVPPLPVPADHCVTPGRTWLVGVCATALSLGLVPIVAFALWSKVHTPTLAEVDATVVEPTACAIPPAPTQPDVSTHTETPETRGASRYAPPRLGGADAREVEQIERMPQPDNEEQLVVLPRRDLDEAKPIAKRRNVLTEQQLTTMLAHAQEVGIGNAGMEIISAYARQIELGKTSYATKGAADTGPILQLRPSLVSLPLRDGPSCVLKLKAAQELQTLSRKLRVYMNALAPPGQDGRLEATEKLRDRLREDLRGKTLEWLRPEAVPTLNQMMMGEDALMRHLLVETLATIPGKQSTSALASRAAFDLSAEVRDAAIAALKDRPAEDWRPVLVSALRYPWAPPADFAAEALVALKDKTAIPELVHQLTKPPAGRPYQTADNRTVIREVVRINHLTNCLLCHPPAVRGNEPVIGLDPFHNLPATMTTNNPGLVQTLLSLVPGTHDYRDRRIALGIRPIKTVNGATTFSVPAPVVIRADITYLRQDFSVSVIPPPPPPAAPAAPGAAPPAPQVLLARLRAQQQRPVRFDFVVRTRQLKIAEKRLREALEEPGDPQREAMLFALRELTGRDEGGTTEAWVKAYPGAGTESRTRLLLESLLSVGMQERSSLLSRYRDAEGVEHTWALARAIPRLSDSSQDLARQALTTRLARLKVVELRKLLADTDPEIRRAAVRACGDKSAMELGADLASLLSRSDATTAQLARAALGKMTGTDLPSEAAWQAWVAERER